MFVEVEMPDGTILEFPEGTSEDVMKSASQKYYSSVNPEGIKRIGRDAALTAQGAAAGITGMVPDLAMLPVNLAASQASEEDKQLKTRGTGRKPVSRAAMNMPPEMRDYEKPPERKGNFSFTGKINEGLGAVTGIKPQNKEEEGFQAGGQVFGGGLFPMGAPMSKLGLLSAAGAGTGAGIASQTESGVDDVLLPLALGFAPAIPTVYRNAKNTAMKTAAKKLDFRQENIDAMEAAGLTPTAQGASGSESAQNFINRLSTTLGGRKIKETAQAASSQADDKLARLGYDPDIQQSEAGRSVVEGVARKEGAPRLRLEKQIATERSALKGNLENLSRATEQEAGRSVVEGSNRYIGREFGRGDRLKGQVTESLRGQPIEVNPKVSDDILGGMRKQDLHEPTFSAFNDDLQRLSWQDLGTGNRYIDIDGLNQLKAKYGRATARDTVEKQATAKAIYSKIKELEEGAAAASGKMIDGQSVSEANAAYNKQFSEGFDTKKSLVGRITKEPIQQGDRIVYADMPLEQSFRTVHSDLLKNPSRFDEIASMLTSPRQQRLFSGNMRELSGGANFDAATWLKNYRKLSDSSKNSLVYGDAVLKGKLDELAISLENNLSKSAPKNPLVEAITDMPLEQSFRTVHNDLLKNPSRYMEYSGMLTAPRKLNLLKGHMKELVGGESPNLQTWAKNIQGMSDDSIKALSYGDKEYAEKLKTLATAISKNKNTAGFAGKAEPAVALGERDVIGRAISAARWAGKVGINAVFGRMLADPKGVQAITNALKVQNAKLPIAKTAYLAQITQLADKYAEEELQEQQGGQNETPAGASAPPNSPAPANPPPVNQPFEPAPLPETQEGNNYSPQFKSAIQTVFKNEGEHTTEGTPTMMGIDSEVWPKEYKELMALPESERPAYAEKFYNDNFWEKYDIGSMPEDAQELALDTVVNHGGNSTFSRKLLRLAKRGISKERLIKMREAEYRRIAKTNPEKRKYLKGWTNRAASFKEYDVAKR